MRIAELFHSRQGEGLLEGTPSVFVRTSGCNLRCWFCDTPYASWRPEGDDLSVEQIVAQMEQLARQHPAERPHAVLTGGEPMIQAELVELCRQLDARNWRLTIETAGTRYLRVACHLMSISPKLSGSGPSAQHWPAWAERHQARRDRPEVVARLLADYPYQLKFVIDVPDDCAEVERYLARFPNVQRDRVLLMPQATDRAGMEEKARWLIPYCADQGLRYCPRRQIEWYGLTRGT